MDVKNNSIISQNDIFFIREQIKSRKFSIFIIIFFITLLITFINTRKMNISLNKVNIKSNSSQKNYRTLNEDNQQNLNSKKKILFIGSTGCDLIINYKKMPKIGETVFGDKFTQKPGAKGISQAIAASRLGANVSFMGAKGDDVCGESIINLLKKNNIKHSLKVIPKTNTQISTIFVDDEGQNIITIIPGANNFVDEQQIDENEQLINEYDIIVLQLEIPIETVEYIIDIAYKKNKIIILNLSPAQFLSKDILKKCNYIIMDKNELSLITGMPTEDNRQIELASQKIFELGVQNLIVILGENGTFLFNKDNSRFFKIIQDYLAKKTVGLKRENDSYVGAFANYLAKDYGLLGTIINTNFAYRFYASSFRDSFPTQEEIDDFISRMSFYS